MADVKRWGVFELRLNGKTDGNPFVDYNIKGRFTGANEDKTVDGFYDGDGLYCIRFMPSFEGEYSYKIDGSFSDVATDGVFSVIEADEYNHGPVRVKHTFHFEYEDGTKYYPCGTTCYVWNLQSEELQKKTLETLSKGFFNKIRFCIFPKHYIHNFNEPISYPFEGTPCDSSVLTVDNFLNSAVWVGNDWNYMKPNPKHFEHIESLIIKLAKLGIEADIIVMHPYDRWGFSSMTREADDLYWKYVLARLSAFHNVWWSFANEYDLLREKTIDDWEHYASIVVANDPYTHLRSIHNCFGFYDYNKPWITHCSIQRQDTYRTTEYTDEWREAYKKPVVLDEIAYEGNVEYGWGNISGKELVRRYWEAFVRGGYPQHGETYLGYDDILWWSHGGDLHGESQDRIKFLREIMQTVPGPGMKFKNVSWDLPSGIPDDDDVAAKTGYQIFYFGFNRPAYRAFNLEEDSSYKVEIIDTWDMTITDVGVYSGNFHIDLPAKEFIAVRVQKI